MAVSLFPGQPEMDQELVKGLFREVAQRMGAYVPQSLSEVYFPSKVPGIFENGTGAFLEVDEKTWLLSCAHVLENQGMIHTIYGFDKFLRGSRPAVGVQHPLDLAAMEVPKSAWLAYGSDARAIPAHQLAQSHVDTYGEILWIGGFPGARVNQMFEMPVAVCQGLPTQQYHFHEEDEVPHESFDSMFHFAVAYSPGNAQQVDPAKATGGHGLSLPPGLSGSLVWNTQRVECHRNSIPWDPSMAIVTGIVWGWPASNYLIATRIEHVHSFFAAAKLKLAEVEAEGTATQACASSR